MSDLRRDFFVTRLIPLEAGNGPDLDSLLREIADAAVDQFAAEGVAPDRVHFIRYGTLRYENQEHGVEVPLPESAVDAEALVGIAETFHAAYEREYTYRLQAPIELVSVHVVAIAQVGKLAPVELSGNGRAAGDARKSRREVDFASDGIHVADVYAGDLLDPGVRFTGPAVVETKGSTAVVHPGCSAEVDAYGNLVISVRQ